MNYPPVAIAILNWNGRKHLEQFLPFLQNISYPNYSIYVIDNNSSDESIHFLNQYYPSIKIINTGYNLGFAGGYNFGILQITEPYILMLNTDVEVTQAFLEPMVKLMETDKTIAACQSKILSYHHRENFEHGGAAGGLIDVLGYTFCRGRIIDTVEKDSDQYPTSEVFWAGGACSLVRRSAYVEVGGMYDYYFMHFEEIDMCWKFHSAGYKVYYCNESVVYHVGGGSLSYQSPRKTLLNFRNNLVMCYRNSPASYRIWWLPVRMMTDAASWFFFLFKKEWKHALAINKAYIQFFDWLFTGKNKYPNKKKSLLDIDTVFKHSIIAQYFLARKKAYSQFQTKS